MAVSASTMRIDDMRSLLGARMDESAAAAARAVDAADRGSRRYDASARRDAAADERNGVRPAQGTGAGTVSARAAAERRPGFAPAQARVPADARKSSRR